MDADKLFDANEARNRSRSITGAKQVSQLNDVIKCIQESADDGKIYMTYGKSLLPNVVSELERRGFKIDFTSDQRDGDFYTIKW
jgi:hypothetical protein